MKFSKASEQMKASEVREILKLAEKPEIISFAGGMPAAEIFPKDKMAAVSAEVLKTVGEKAMQYTATDGYLPLREKIAERMNNKVGTKVSASSIILTNGSQQGLDFVAKIFVDKDDVILVEKPTYLGALTAFRPYQPNIVEVPSDENGMILSELEAALKKHNNVKFVYVIPDFQNPTGLSWSLERRQGFLDIMAKTDIAIVEDNPYGELRFVGEPLPSLAALDKTGNVIFLGTFSKIFAPGYRLGWACANEEIIEKFNLTKQGADLQASTIAQYEVNKFLDMYSLDEHVNTIIDVYAKRRICMLDAMKKYLPDTVKWTIPDGGLFTWVEFPKNVNARELLVKCLEKNVAFVPGGAFFASPDNENYARLNYSAMPEEKIEEGIKRFGEALNEFLV